MIPVPNWFLPNAPGLVRRATFSLALGGVFALIVVVAYAFNL